MKPTISIFGPTDPRQWAILKENNPDVIINSAAYTAVDKAEENIELTTGGKVDIDSAELIATTQNTTRINARKTRISGNNIDIGGKTNITLITPTGAIKVKKIISRDVNWATQVFAGTSVPPSALNAAPPTPPPTQGGFGGGVGNPTNRRGSGARR